MGGVGLEKGPLCFLWLLRPPSLVLVSLPQILLAEPLVVQLLHGRNLEVLRTDFMPLIPRLQQV